MFDSPHLVTLIGRDTEHPQEALLCPHPSPSWNLPVSIHTLSNLWPQLYKTQQYCQAQGPVWCECDDFKIIRKEIYLWMRRFNNMYDFFALPQKICHQFDVWCKRRKQNWTNSIIRLINCVLLISDKIVRVSRKMLSPKLDVAINTEGRHLPGRTRAPASMMWAPGVPHPVHGEECPPSCRPHRPRRPRLLSLLLQGGVVTVGSIVTHIYNILYGLLF